MRRHGDHPEAELTELLRWLDMKDSDAISQMEKETQQLLTDKNLKSLVKLNGATAINLITKLTKGPLPHGRDRRTVADPILRDYYDSLVHDPSRAEGLFAGLLALSEASEHGDKAAEKVVVELSTKFQAQLNQKGLNEWVAKASAISVVSILDFTSRYADTRIKRSSAHRSILEAVNELKARRSTYALALVLYSDRNEYVRTEIMKLLADETQPHEIRSHLLMAPEFVTSQPTWWPLLVKLAETSDPQMRQATMNHIEFHRLIYGDDRVKALQARLPNLKPSLIDAGPEIDLGLDLKFGCPASLKKIQEGKK